MKTDRTNANDYMTGRTCESMLDVSIESKSTAACMFRKSANPLEVLKRVEIKELEEQKSRLVVEIQKLSTSLAHLRSVN